MEYIDVGLAVVNDFEADPEALSVGLPLHVPLVEVLLVELSQRSPDCILYVGLYCVVFVLFQIRPYCQPTNRQNYITQHLLQPMIVNINATTTVTEAISLIQIIEMSMMIQSKVSAQCYFEKKEDSRYSFWLLHIL